MFYTTVLLIHLILFAFVYASDKVYISVHLDTNTNENVDIIVFYIIPNISIRECMEDCKSRKRCQFVNYIARSNTCFLLGTNGGVSISASSALTRLTDMPGYLFGINKEWDPGDEEICETCQDIGPCSSGIINANVTSSISTTCKTSGCDDPTQEKAVVYGTQFITGNSIKYLCSTSYIINISTTNIAECQQNGTWSSTDFTCIYDCGSLIIADGSFTATSGTTEGMTATLSCDVGFVLSGSSLITCTESGWDGSATCPPIDCGAPTLINGQFTATSGTIFGMSATLYCNPGYDFSGDALVTCTASGWDGSGTCTPMDCGTPTVDNGQVNAQYGTTFGKSVTVNCDTGYVLSGDTLMTCTENGWDGSATCTFIDCGNPTPQYATADSTVYTYGSVIKITCNAGLTITGSSSIECQADSTWSDSPSCGCSSNQQMYGTSCYEVIKQGKSWNEAKSHCESIGGHLVDVNSNGEQQFVVTLIKANDNSNSYWTGGNDKGREGVFRWSDGTLMSSGYEYWHSSQPDESRGGEDCVDIIPGTKFNYHWNDNVCTYSLLGICEIDL